MVNLIAYGSLLHKEELFRQGIDPAMASAVIVHGFKRSFNQEPSWRESAGRNRAVLSVIEQEGFSFNAILIKGLDRTKLECLDQRERGYTRVTVGDSQVTPFCERDSPDLGLDTFLYCGKTENRNDALLPNASYLELCVRGALHWGSEFAEAFLVSTYIDQQSVREFLETHPM